MKNICVYSCLLVLILLIHPPASADGGILSLKHQAPLSPLCRLLGDSNRFEFRSTHQAMMPLDRQMPEEIYLFSASDRFALTFAVTVNQPLRLFVDLNRDQKCQPEEVFLPLHENDRWIFEKVPMPVIVGDQEQVLEFKVIADIQDSVCHVRFIPSEDILLGCIEPILWQKEDRTYRNWNWVAPQSMTLNQQKQEVFVFEIEWIRPSRFLAVGGDEPKLYFKRDGDESGEDYEIIPGAQKDEWNLVFHDIPVSVQMGEEWESIQITLSAYLRDHIGLLTGCEIRSYYEGLVLLDGAEYPARLRIPFLLDSTKKRNEIVVLDSNQDGIFDYLTDVWFSSQGFIEYGGKPWVVSTEYSSNEARVELRPYRGAMGTLKVVGEGFMRTMLQLSPEDTAGFSDEASFPVCIGHLPGHSYALPVGEANIEDEHVWVDPGGDSEYLYQGGSYLKSFEIQSGEELILSLGGRMKDRVQARVRWFESEVNLSYTPPINFQGISFSSIYRSPIYRKSRPPAPRFQMTSWLGTVIQSGQFEYG